MGETSIGGGTRGVGYGLSKSMFDNGACQHVSLNLFTFIADRIELLLTILEEFQSGSENGLVII